MTIAVVIAAFFAVVAASLVFFVVRRMVRWAFRLALLAAVAVAVLFGAGALWWYSASDNADAKPKHPAASSTNTSRTPAR